MVGRSISHYEIIEKLGEGGMGVDGGRPRRLTPGPSDENVPNWSRDGRWVYFASNRGGRYEVWRIPGVGAENRKTLYYVKEHSSPLFARALAGREERQVLGSSASLKWRR